MKRFHASGSADLPSGVPRRPPEFAIDVRALRKNPAIQPGCILLAILLTCVSAGAEELSNEVEAKVRAASVFVRCPLGANANPGAGFLIRKDATGGIVLTNAWCVGLANTVEITFQPGTADEKSVEGIVLAVDPGRLLATIRIPPDGLPDCLPIAPKTAVSETQTVFSAGLPGADTAITPKVRMLQCAVSSLRRNSAGQVIAIQLAGDITAGDTGAALVDKRGEVVGVTVGKIRGTQTAFAVAPEDIQAFLGGDWSEITFTVISKTDTKAKLEVSVALVNPAGSLKSATLAIAGVEACRRPNEPVPPDKNGAWSKCHAAMREVTLKISESTGTATFEVEREPGTSDFDSRFQFRFGDAAKGRWTEVISARVTIAVGRSDRVVNPRKIRSVAAPDAGLPEAKLEPLVTSEKVRELARLSRRSVMSDLHLSPNGKEVIVLDRSDGLVLKLDAESLNVIASVEAPHSVAALSVTPDWKSVWVVCACKMANKSGIPVDCGVAQRFALPDLKPDKPVDLERSPKDLVVTNAGILIFTEENGTITVFDPVKGSELASVPGGRGLVLSPNQRVLYFIASSGPKAMPVGTIPAGGDPTWDCKGASNPAPSDISLSSDGRWMVMSNGFSSPLTGTRAGDFQVLSRFDAGISIAIAPGKSTFFEATERGTLRELQLGELKVLREIPVGSRLSEMHIDSATCRLFAISTPLSPASKKPEDPQIGDVVAISMAEK